VPYFLSGLATDVQETSLASDETQAPLGKRGATERAAMILRNGNATLMRSLGALQKLRQERLGHADGSPITESVYTRLISVDGKRVAAQLGSEVWGVLDAIGRQLDVKGGEKKHGSEWSLLSRL
jgi:hypothetical protein